MTSNENSTFRWPRRRLGQVHIVLGPSSIAGRERTACDMNLLVANYDRTVGPVDCQWCLEALADARAGRFDRGATSRLWGVDNAIRREMAAEEAKRGRDETIETAQAGLPSAN